MPEAYHCRYHRRRGEGLRKGRTEKKDCLETDSPFIMRSWLTSAAAEETGRTAAPALGKADVVLSTDAARGVYDWLITRLPGATVTGIGEA